MMSRHGEHLAYELRDGVLQDLAAIGLLIETARLALRSGGARSEIDAILQSVQGVAQSDLAELRSVIDRLRPAA